MEINYSILPQEIMRTALFIAICSLPSITFAAAGIADRFYDHRHWVYPAYVYCLLFGLIVLIGLLIAFLIMKNQVLDTVERISKYMKNRPMSAILFIGFLTAIPVGIISSVAWEIFGFISLYLYLILLGVFPVFLICKYQREHLLLSPLWIKWSIMISIAAIIASLLFIMLTICHILPIAEVSYYNIRRGVLTHPYDSMKEIWQGSIIFCGEIVIALMLEILSRVCNT